MFQKSIIILFFALSNSLLVKAQNPDTVYIKLFDCYKMVRQNAACIKSFNLIDKQTELQVKSAGNSNLPHVSAFGKATYQSDAITFNIPVAGIEGIEVDQFQYNAGVSVDQKLFDGGLAGLQKELAERQGKIKTLENEVNLYKLNSLVNSYFFGILTFKQSLKILKIKIESLEERRKVLESGVNNGIVLRSELQRIESEIYLSEQHVLELNSSVLSLERSLKEYAGIDPDKIVKWETPLPDIVQDSINRSELELFQANRNYFQTLQQVQNRRYLPKIAAYGQAGYSYPGLNMFENEAATYYIVGVKMSWNIWDWKQAGTEKQLLELNKQNVNIMEEDFQKNLSVSVISQKAEIEKLEKLILKDELIIKTKEAITQSSASALDNGTITSADYLTDLNSELLARFNSEKHKINLLEAQANYSVLMGINNN